MKKLGLIVLSLVIFFTNMLMANTTYTLLDKRNVDTLIYKEFKEKKSSVNQRKLTTWYLCRTNYREYKKFKDNEFEFDGVLDKYSGILNNKIEEKSNFYKSKIFTVKMKTAFQKYNFEKSLFPVELLTEGGYLKLYGDRLIHHHKLSFINTDKSKNIMRMKKDKARKFLKEKRSKRRLLIAKYYFTIIDIDADINRTLEGRSMCSDPVFSKVKAEIQKVDIMDEKGRLLDTITY